MTPRFASLAAVVCLLVPLPARAGLFPASSFSAKARGTTGAAFLKLPASARAMALGTSYVAVADRSEALFWNPAGLAGMADEGASDVSLSFNSLLETAYASSLAFARPLSENRGVWGASLVYYSQSSIQGYTPLGDVDSEFAPSDIALSGAYANKVGRFAFGGGIKFIRAKISDASGTTLAFDLGVQVQRISDIAQGALDLGLSLRNLGPGIKVGSVADPLPFKLQLGAHWHVSPRLALLLDGHMPVDESPHPSLGAEWTYPVNAGMKAALRGGLNPRNERDIAGFSLFSAGFGVELTQARIDYAWVPLGDLGMTHRVSLGFKF